MDEILKYLGFYHLLGYSVLGLLLLLTGFRRRKKIIVEISQFFLIIPLSGMIIYETIDFRDTERITARLLMTLLYTFFLILFIAVAKRRVGLKAGVLVWFLVFEFLFLTSIASYTYYRSYYTYDEEPEVATIAVKNRERLEARNYLQYIEIEDLVVEAYKDIDEGESLLVRGEIKNSGRRTIKTLSMKIRLLDHSNAPIYDETLNIVFEQKPLLAGKRMKFELRLREKPPNWAEGSFSFMVNKLKLEGHHLVTDLDALQEGGGDDRES